MMRRPPPPARNRPPPIKEIATHCALVELLSRPGLVNPRKWQWTHIPLGEYRPIETAAKLQRMGVKPGWPDFIFLSWTSAVYFLELKTATGALEDEQLHFIRTMIDFKIECRVARTFEDAVQILKGWGVLPTVNVQGTRDALGKAYQVLTGEAPK